MLSQKMGLCVLGASALLSGCGGGGGDAMEVATVPLSMANYSDIAQTVAGGVMGSDSVFDTFSNTASAKPQVSADLRTLGSGRVADMGRLALSKLTTQPLQREQPKAVWEETESCTYGGNITYVENDVDNDGQESVGDRVTFIAQNCFYEPNLPPLNGTLGMRLLAVSYDRFGDLLSISAELSFDQFSSLDVLLNGKATFSLDSTKATLVYQQLSAQYAGQTLVYNYSFILNSTNFVPTGELSGLFSINGSTYTLSTPKTLQMGSVYPISGTLRIADGRGNRVDMPMNLSGFESHLYLSGDELRDAQSTTLWSAL